MAPPTVEDEVLELTRRLLDSIIQADWQTYAELCDPGLTAFEPEGRGQLVEGLPFHKYYFDLGTSAGPRCTTLAQPRVRLLGSDVALVTYLRLTQRLNASGVPETAVMEETRIWQRQEGRWKHVHFHRSAPS